MNDTTTFARFAADVLALYEPPLRRIATYRKTRQVLEEFGTLCQGPQDLTRSTIARWVASHGDRRRTTLRSLLSALRAAVNLAGADHGIANPFEGRKLHTFLPTSVHHRRIERHITPAQTGRILERADREAEPGGWTARRLRVLLYLAAFTGARAKELLGARVEDVDLVGRVIRIRPNERRALKTEGSERDIHISLRLLPVLAEWIRRPDRPSPWLLPNRGLEGPWFHGSTSSRPIGRVKALAGRAGVPGVTILSFRHGFATAADPRRPYRRSSATRCRRRSGGIATPMRRSSGPRSTASASASGRDASWVS